MKRIILASTLLTAVTAVAVMAGSAHAATADAAVAAPVLSMSAVATTSSYGASVSWDVSAPWWTDSCSVTNDTYSWHRGDTMTSECTVATQVQVRSIVTAHGSVYRAGFHTSARSSGAYQAGGNCNTSRDGWDGRISTCLWAHASLSYTLTLPRGTTFNSISHSVSAGMTHDFSWGGSARRYLTIYQRLLTDYRIASAG